MTSSPDPGLEAREKLRRFICEVAAAVAPGWERQRARIEEAVAPIRTWMVRELAPRAGDTILELAAGVGDTGFDAAAIAGDTGRLISTDISPAMIEVAHRRGAERGLSTVDYRLMDAERLALDDRSVDGVLCRFGYMFVADLLAALAEARRVLRPGRRLALAVWGAAERNPWMTILEVALIERGHVPPPDPGAPSPFSMGNQDVLRGLLERAGFAQVHMEEVEARFAFRDMDDYMAYAADTAGPLAMVLRQLSDDERKAVSAQLGQAFAPFAGQRGFDLPGLALAAAAG